MLDIRNKKEDLNKIRQDKWPNPTSLVIRNLTGVLSTFLPSGISFTTPLFAFRAGKAKLKNSLKISSTS